jgi:hypothetical protein
MKTSNTLVFPHDLEIFEATRNYANAAISDFRSDEMCELQFSEIESQAMIKGLEFSRLLIQGQLDLRAAKESRLEQVTGADGVERQHVRKDCEHKIMTLCGEVTASRLGYNRYGSQFLFPLDKELNLPIDHYSYGLRRRTGEEVSRGSYDQMVSIVGETTGGKVPKRQARQLAVDIAQDFEAFYATGYATGVEETCDLLILSLDGKGMVMRKEGLTEATRKKAEKEKQKTEMARLSGSKGDGNRKRMATVAAVYSIPRHVRSPESIMREGNEAHVKRPKWRNKRVWASIERKATVVTEEVFAEAIRRDPTKSRSWTIVVDGQPQQLKNIQSCMKQHEIENVTLILDFIHVLEYLWKAAHSFGFQGNEAEAWVRKRALNILRGKASDVAAGIRRSATLRKVRALSRKVIDTSVEYFLKYANMMKYDQYLAAGRPIASGVIEGACRHLIKDRMDITGARWGLQGAEAILKLRSLKSSGDFDEYWNFYKTQSHQRNHLSRYASLPLPTPSQIAA